MITLKVYALNNRTLKYIKQNLTEIQEEIDNSIIIVKGFNPCLSKNVRTCREKIRKNIVDLIPLSTNLI